jgi:hypothetical protein
MLWVDAGRPRKAVEDIGDAIRAQAEAAAGAKQQAERSKALAAIAALSQELLMRTSLVPEECYYALAAATCVREDESDPAVIDPAIHQDKIDTFRLAGRAGHAFFTTPILKATLGVVYTTESNWKASRPTPQMRYSLRGFVTPSPCATLAAGKSTMRKPLARRAVMRKLLLFIGRSWPPARPPWRAPHTNWGWAAC